MDIAVLTKLALFVVKRIYIKIKRFCLSLGHKKEKIYIFIDVYGPPATTQLINVVVLFKNEAIKKIFKITQSVVWKC